MTDRRPIPDRLLRIAGSLVPNADLGEARLAGGQFHDVVLLPGVAAVRVARRPAAAAELPRRTALLRRLGSAGLPFRVPEPITEVSIVDGSTAVAVSWVEGAPGQRGVGDPAQLRRLIDALAAVDLSDLGPVLGPPHAYCGAEHWAEVIEAEVVPRLPPRWHVEVRGRTEAALALPA